MAGRSSMAKEKGIDDPKGNLLAEGTATAVKQLRSRVGAVAMVGGGEGTTLFAFPIHRKKLLKGDFD